MFILACASILTLFGVAAGKEKPPFEPLKVRIGAYENPPKIFVDNNGNVSGFWPDLIAEIASREGWRVEYVFGTWSEGLERLRRHEIDIMPDVAFTEKRTHEFFFSERTVLMSWSRLYVHKHETTIRSIRDLDHKRIAALRSSVNLDGDGGLKDIVRGFNLDCTFEELDDYGQVFRAISEGRVDAGVTNRNFGNRYAADYDVEKTPIIFQPINMKFALPRGLRLAPLLLRGIDKRMTELIEAADSPYYQLLAKYFEAEIARKPVMVFPQWASRALRGGAFLLITFLVAVIVSRIQVRRKTNEVRQKNEALAAEKERLAVTLASIGDGVIATDLDGKVVLLNKVAERLTGWPQEEANGQPLEKIFNIVDEKTRKPRTDPVRSVLDSGEIVGMANHTVLVSRNGREMSIADSGAPIRDPQSKIIGVILVFRDVTDKRRMEEDALKVRKLESVGVLAGGIAHDFNNILVSVIGNIGMALTGISPTDERYDLLKEAEKASLRARDLTQQLLTFSKGGEPVKEIASIDAIIRDSADFVLRGSNVRCEYRFSDDLHLLEIDTGQISQVIQNIVMNANQAMPDGGVIMITCGNCDDAAAEEPVLGRGKYVKMRIKDQGVGIPANLVERIFDPYFTTKHQGNGLGLSITHSIIRKHDGHIAVHSEPGKGSTFTIYLPASEKSVPASVARSADAVEECSGKILLMDDDEMVRTVTRTMLCRIGYEVVLAEDGREALAQYEQAIAASAPFDLVIVDLTVPGGMGGNEAAKAIRAIDPEARIVVSSGYSTDPIMANYRDHGYCATIVKPYQLPEIRKVLRQALQ